MVQEVGPKYKKIIQQYLESQREEDLYVGQKFSRRFIEKEISPEDVISIHKTALQEIYPDLPTELWYSFDFLIEMMIHYGLALQEHQSLIRKQEALQLEMNIATKVQETLLKTKVPKFEGLDIGFLSFPSKQMSGDYIYFVSDEKNYASVAIADVIGKGIPAALCMSMIKFGMDSMQSENVSPRIVLDIVNRIVEESIDDSMFISMFYGNYCAKGNVFSFASAGHEPALLYKASDNSFIELDAKGLLLGVQADVDYEERSVVLENGDFIAMMTDGVTETRTDEGFIDEELIKTLLKEKKNHSAQEIAYNVYEHLWKMQNFQLHDDFTIVIFKKR